VDAWLLLFISTFATYRTSRMVALEEGAFKVFALIRSLDIKQNTWIGRGLHCPLCLSFWFGFLFAIPFWGWYYPVFALGLSGGAIFIYQIDRRISR
jgi:hypothetical protein